MRQEVATVIESLRPLVRADGGDLVLGDVDEIGGIVTVGVTGSCGTCPGSIQSLRTGIERIVRDHVRGVVRVDAAPIATLDGTPVTL